MHLLDIKDAAKKKLAAAAMEKLVKFATGHLDKLKFGATALKLKASYAKARAAVEKALKAAPKDADLAKLLKALDKAKGTIDDNVKAAKAIESVAVDIKALAKQKDIKQAVALVKDIDAACKIVGKAAAEDKVALAELSAAAGAAAKTAKDPAVKTALLDLQGVAKALAAACETVSKVAPEVDKLALVGLKVLT